MYFLLTAAIAAFGADPFSKWLVTSPWAADLSAFEKSLEITVVFGGPGLLLTLIFLLACYGVACVTLNFIMEVIPALWRRPQYYAQPGYRTHTLRGYACSASATRPDEGHSSLNNDSMGSAGNSSEKA